MAHTLITDEMRGLVGRVMKSATAYPIAASDIRKWAMAVYWPEVPPRIHWDEEYAATTEWKGIIAPDEFSPFGWMTKDPPPRTEVVAADGYKKYIHIEEPFGLFLDWPRAILQSRVVATYSGVRMRPDDVIRSETSISEYFEREGKMGLQLYTTVSDNLYNQHGEWIKRLDTVFLRYQ